MTPITLPQADIPLGWANVGGQRVPVSIDPEWMRPLFEMLQRSGGITGSGSFADYLPLLAAPAGTSPEAKEALRAVDELRNEVASLRGDNRRLASEVEQLAAQITDTPPAPDLTSRVQQIEDRLA